MSSSVSARGDDTERRLQTAYRVTIALGTLVVALALALAWLARSPRGAVAGAGGARAPATGNLIQKKFPDVDFTAVYPGMSAADIDQLQRDCLGLRYAYAPFVQFAPQPTAGRFLNITTAGYRRGRTDAPWPPRRGGADVVVFVFGGSTTLGFGLPDTQTLPSALEAELARHFPGRAVHAYNFGRGYYFSTQERLLFELLLQQALVPDLAVFVDGLNEFVYADGVPERTAQLAALADPDLAPPLRAEPADDTARAAAVDALIARYRANIRLTEGLAQAFGVQVIFVGQPVPFRDFPLGPATYPFPSTFVEHRLAGWGYDRFMAAARDGQFGDHFVWCGNAFADARRIMYVDSIHYSAQANEVLARCLVERAGQVGLIP